LQQLTSLSHYESLKKIIINLKNKKNQVKIKAIVPETKPAQWLYLSRNYFIA